ncbi:MAG: hypothetical protein GKR89_25285 [Candidatus Latescibacteria bacterium]|nr:hypothetical protein [Candidatus Latescibacterota bacterium]
MGFMWKRNVPAKGRPKSQISNWLPGTEGVVLDVPGSSRLVARLRELGLIPGVPIRLLRTGSALIIQIPEGRFCLRKKDAETIRVRPA